MHPLVNFFYSVGWIVLIVLGCLVASAQGWAYRRIDPATLNIRRLSDSIGALCVVGLVLHAASLEAGGFGPLLRFLGQVPSIYSTLPPLVLLSLATLAVLTVTSLLRLAIGACGQFPPRNTMTVIGDFAWIGGAAAAWLYGIFIPAAWDWGSAGETINFGFKNYLLFAIASSSAEAVLVLRGRGRRPKGPTPYQKPRGDAGNASRQQALDALRSDGGRKLRVDEERF